MAGFTYNPLTDRWSISDDVGVNFILFGTKMGMHRREENPTSSS